MRKYLFFILLVGFVSAQGPYTVGTITEEEGLRDGPESMNPIIYYPADADYLKASIILVPGFMSWISSIEEWGPYLASWGYVAMFVNCNWIWGSTDDRAYALLDGLITIEEENERIASPLFHNLDLNNIAVGGWSRGGGGALKAAVLDSDIKTVLALSAWLEEVTPEELVVNAPVLFISGELDDNAANDIHTNIFYDYIPEETDKLLFEVAEGTHSTVTNPYNSYQTVGVAALHWLAEYLYYLPFCHIMAESPTTASQYITNIECEILGDINNDENLNSLDVILLLGIIVNSLEYESHANIDFDGRLNIFDLYHIIDQVY